MACLTVILGRSRQGIYGMLRRDPTFPKPVKMGTYAIAWHRSEIEAWMSNLERVEPCGLSAVDRRVMNAAARAGGA